MAQAIARHPINSSILRSIFPNNPRVEQQRLHGVGGERIDMVLFHPHHLVGDQMHLLDDQIEHLLFYLFDLLVRQRQAGDFRNIVHVQLRDVKKSQKEALSLRAGQARLTSRPADSTGEREAGAWRCSNF